MAQIVRLRFSPSFLQRRSSLVGAFLAGITLDVHGLNFDQHLQLYEGWRAYLCESPTIYHHDESDGSADDEWVDDLVTVKQGRSREQLEAELTRVAADNGWPWIPTEATTALLFAAEDEEEEEEGEEAPQQKTTTAEASTSRHGGTRGEVEEEKEDDDDRQSGVMDWS